MLSRAPCLDGRRHRIKLFVSEVDLGEEVHQTVFLLSNKASALSGSEVIADQGMSSRLGAF
ncbi:hypothetical protein LPU83_pLPU83c_0782 (plasmid) [Rhizobium favelukesii]|uniref:Uncharacterized protein n=1 Tax=Rhizobium favelukesii TaxID=348824 RepID=W6RKF9_9HYPH|nr:hypothetical protein LPU83_pLPU83c_0782 [Rhizobium favelukesii]